MIAEALRLMVAPRVEGLSVTGWAEQWSDYARGDRGIADIIGVATQLPDAPPLVVLIAHFAREGTRTIAIGRPHSAQELWRAQEAGVAAWIDIAASLDEIAGALAAAQLGTPYFSAGIQRMLDSEPSRAVPLLSPRELEAVDAYVNSGLSSMDLVSASVGLATTTVRSHIAAVRRRYREMDVELPTKLALRARLIEDGWIHAAERSLAVR